MRRRTTFAAKRRLQETSYARRRSVPANVERCEPRTLLAVTYHGGPVLSNAEVETVYYGQAWGVDPQLQQQENLLDGFFSSITQSSFMGLLAQYSTPTQTIGSGSFVGRDVVNGASSPVSGATISDTQIQAMIQSEINSGRIAQPDGNQVVFVIPPPNVLVTDGTSNSVNDFLGYHGDFHDAQRKDVIYAVIADPVGNADLTGTTTIQQLTAVSSHELAEAITDPSNPAGWYQDSTGEEIADLANDQSAFLNHYLIQQLWSNNANAVVAPAGSSRSDPQTLAAVAQDLNLLEGAGSTGVVATFTDSGANDPLANYAATIDWGDGSTSQGVISVDPNTPGTLDVTGTHSYGSAEAGVSFPLNVTVNDLIDTETSTATSAAHIIEAPLTATGLTITPTKGTAFTGAVATFTDPNSFATVADYTASINWGDGSTSTATVTASSSGGFSVSGTHTYAQETTYHATVTIVDGGSLAFATATANVADLPLTAVAQPIAATEGTPFAGIVATFTDADASGVVADYTATIAWGDGSTSTGTIAANAAGGFKVSGTHTFGGLGAAPSVVVTINDVGGAIATATDSATITDAPLTVTGQTAVATEGASFSGSVASFTDADPAGKVANDHATIAWGDGSTSAGTIAANATGGFNVSGTHTYSEEGSFPTGITVNDVGGATASGAATVQVSDPSVVPTSGLPIAAVEGAPGTWTLTTFVDPGGAEAPGDYAATIAWGDGSGSAGTITQSNGVFTVAGTHTYLAPGSDSFVVTIAHDSAPAVQTFGTATVADAPLVGAASNLTTRVAATFNSVVASFTDADPNATPANYTATVAWGDGSTSAGTISTRSGGGFNVAGTHAYSAAGSFAVAVAVRDAGGAAFSGTATAKVTSEAPANFDGTGVSEFAVFRPSTAKWNIAGHALSVSYGATNLNDVPVPGDYDGTGHTEFAVFRPSTAQWIIAGHAQPITFGAKNLTDIPVPGDYDGIGRTELAVFRPSTAQWIITNPITGTQRVVTFGAKNLTDIPVPGDYDGIGRTELAVFRPKTAQWIIMNPITGTQRIVTFGAKNLADIPVPGDYDGTGRTELAVFRPSTAQWIILNPLTGTQRVVTFGATKLFDIPVETSIASLKKLGLVGSTKIKSAGLRATPAPSSTHTVVAIAPSDPPVAQSPATAPTRSALAVHLAALESLDAAGS